MWKNNDRIIDSVLIVLNCSMARYNGRLHCIVGVLPTCYKRKAATYFYPPGGTGPRNREPGTGNREPETRNWEPGTRNREPGTRNREPGSRNREAGIGNREPGTGNREPGTGNREPRTGNRKPGTGNQEPGTRNREPGTGNREPGTGNRESGTGNRELTTLIEKWSVNFIPHRQREKGNLCVKTSLALSNWRSIFDIELLI